MSAGQSWKTRFDINLHQAEAARAVGNEGKARVCARRAAGIVVEEYLRRQGLQLTQASAYAQLRFLADQAEVAPAVRSVAGHFLLHVSVEHKLPLEADLIDEALWLASQLLS